MRLSGVAISHHSYCFHGNNLAFKPAIHVHGKTVVGNDGRLGLASAFSGKAFCVMEKLGKTFNVGRDEVWFGGRAIKAVATLEVAGSSCNNEGVKGSVLRAVIESVRVSRSMVELQVSSDESSEVDEGEKLRRMRISRANKGMTPWNKGRKHSAETIRRIKERTKLAMQDPKIRMKMKLINMGNAQTEETKMKIGAGVRLGWERRRQKLALQETCHYEWQNLIAEAACKGLLGEEQLEWDSYKTLNEQPKQEFLQRGKKRRSTERMTGNKRAPKSTEQRRKISEAISAKWADPEYRSRVFSGLAKYHGISERVGIKLGRDRRSQKRSPAEKDESHNLEKHKTTSQVQPARLAKSKAPSYEDPLASSKLEMIKNIRAQRAAVMNKKNEAVSRAKLLIAKAEAAAKALEGAAQSSDHVQAALVESRTLITKANQFLESIENGDPFPFENNNDQSVYSTESVNGFHKLPYGDIKVEDFGFSEFLFPDLANGHASNSSHNDLHKTKQALHPTQESNHRANCYDANYKQKQLTWELKGSKNGEGPKRQGKIIKKWIRGRLVEVMEEP